MATTFVTFQLVKVAAYAYYKKSDSAGAVALRNFVGNNTFSVEALEAEKSLRENHPSLLHPDEAVHLSFRASQDQRDHSYLTSHRILLLDTKGATRFTQRHNYKSVPYGSIQAFSLQSNAVGDSLLSVWSAGGSSVATVAFAKGQVKVWHVQQFLNLKVLGNFTDATIDAVMEPPELDLAQGESSFLEWLADKNKTGRMQDVRDRLQQEFPVLLKNETVDVCYPWGDGISVLTSHRMLSIEVQKSMMDTVVELKTVLWPCLQAIKVRTQLDAEKRTSAQISLYTNITGLPSLQQQHKDTGNDDTGVHRRVLIDYITNRLLKGANVTDVQPTDLNASLTTTQRGQDDNDNSSGWFQSSHPKNKPLDAAEMTTKFSTEPNNLLQPNEKIEMAFQGHKGGVLILFTPLRIIRLDPQAVKGSLLKGAQQASLASIPWKSMVGFGVRTAAGKRDPDAEVLLWTETEPCQKGKLKATTEPGMAFWELEFSKTLVDILVLKKYLAQRCFAAPSLGSRPNVDLSGSLHPQYHTDQTDDDEPEALERFFQEETAAVLDRAEIDAVLHSRVPVLLDEETVALAWKAGRDSLCVFTNGRVLLVDAAKRNKNVEYKSIPYTSLRSFSVRAQKDWQSHTELKLYTRNAWTLAEVTADFGKTQEARADLVKLQQFLSAVLFGGAEDVQKIWDTLESLDPVCSSSLESNIRWIQNAYKNQKSKEELLEAMTQQLKSELPILLPNEVCEQVHCNAFLVHVYTNLRVLVIDCTAKGETTIQIQNLPFRWVSGYEVETAASSRDPDAEVYLTSDFRGDQARMQQKLLTKEGDVMEMGQYLTQKILF